MQAQSDPNDSIPRAIPSPSRPVANKSVSLSLLIVVFALVSYAVVREWSYITHTLIPRVKHDAYVSFGPTVTPTPPIAQQSTRSSLENVFISYDSQGVIVTDRRNLHSQRLISSTYPTRILQATPGSTDILMTQMTAGWQTVSVYSLGSRTTTEVFRFQAPMQDVPFEKSVSVSPSGRYVAYSHGYGDLSLYDRSTGEDRLIALGRPCEKDATASDCYGYFEPLWSPQGEQLLVNKHINDSNTLVVLHPFSQPMESDDLHLAGRDGTWLPSGTALLAAGQYENIYYAGHFVDVTTTSLLTKYFPNDPPRVGSLALSAHTILALTYTQSPSAAAAPALGLYDVKTQQFSVLDTGHAGAQWDVMSWLDDTDEVVVRIRKEGQTSFKVYSTQNDARHQLIIPGEYGFYVGSSQ